MIGRRAVVFAGAAALARPAAADLPVPAGNTLAFRLIRHGSEIGRHTLTFEPRGDALTVRVAVDAQVTLLSIPLVRYRHRAVETWQGGTLVGLTGESDKNGQREWMKAGRTSEGLVVLGSRTARYVAPDPALGTTYWNRRMLDAPMISLEDGVLLRPTVAVSRQEAVRVASGDAVAADHYSLRGAFDADVWYDRRETWVGLAIPVADGSEVHYERL
jgi:hypothetical protein